ncbi:MAG TPA: hypothetical protein VN778_00585 [Verrucomicrobiae bacterium]|nr:hypothetical protein [Verrucomicrobiae bacterium]
MQFIVPVLREMASWGPDDPDFTRIYSLAKELAKYLDASDEDKDEADFAADRILEKLDSALAHYQKINAPNFASLNTTQQHAEYEGLYGALWSTYKDRMQKYLKKCGVNIGFIFFNDVRFEQKATEFAIQDPDLGQFVDFLRKQRSGWQNDLVKNRNAHEHDGDLRSGIPDYDNPMDAKRLFAQVCWTMESLIGNLVSWRLKPEWNVIDTAPNSTVFNRQPRFIVEHAIMTAQREKNEQRSSP